MASLENKYGKSAVDATRRNALPPYLDTLFEGGIVNKTDIATTSALGLVKPDGDTVTIDADGTIHSDSGNFYFSNKAVAASAWVADTTYEDYPVKATVTCTGVTANDGVDLVFGMEDATSGNFAPIANTVSNGVEIWAKKAAAITIPTIIIHPPANGSIATPTATWLDQVYPVGSIYSTSSNTNPASLFGGSWSLISHTVQNIDYTNTTNIQGSFPANPLSTSTNTYTFSTDGWVYLYADDTKNYSLMIYINDVAKYWFPGYASIATTDVIFPVIKGEVMKIVTDAATATWTIRDLLFYPNSETIYNWKRTA